MPSRNLPTSRLFTPIAIMLLAGVFTSLGSSRAVAQAIDEWDVPWTVVGDTADYDEDAVITVTGTIRGDNGQPIARASVSADSYKHFDHADANGKYLLHLPTGKYRVLVRHIGYK